MSQNGEKIHPHKDPNKGTEMVLLALFVFILGFTLGTCRTSYVENKHNETTRFTVNAGTFDRDVDFLITTDTSLVIKQACDSMGLEVYGDELISMSGLTLIRDGEMLVWINDREEGVLAHELAHVTFELMRYADVPISECNEEIFCYEIQYLTKQFYKEWHIQNKQSFAGR